jgi:hypothetical protein
VPSTEPRTKWVMAIVLKYLCNMIPEIYFKTHALEVQPWEESLFEIEQVTRAQVVDTKLNQR